MIQSLSMPTEMDLVQLNKTGHTDGNGQKWFQGTLNNMPQTEHLPQVSYTTKHKNQWNHATRIPSRP